IELLLLRLNRIVQLHQLVGRLSELRICSQQVRFERHALQHILASLAIQLPEKGDGRLHSLPRTFRLNDSVVQAADFVGRRLARRADLFRGGVDAQPRQIDPQPDAVLLRQRLRNAPEKNESELKWTLECRRSSRNGTNPRIDTEDASLHRHTELRQWL